MVSKRVRKGLITAVLAFVFTMVFALINVEEARADWYFSRTSIKKCDITLEKYCYDWTGKEIRPRVAVEHEGKRLRENVDYELVYSDNTDAGKEACVKVKGINEYRSSEKVYFEIDGIDISYECTFTIMNGRVEVYYNDRIVSKNNYDVNEKSQSRRAIKYEVVNNKKQYVTYEVVNKYEIRGKGQYCGRYVLEEVTYEKVLENRPDVKPDEPKPQPGEPGGPGHGPGPGPNPGGPGHGPAPSPNPGGPGHGPRP